jgi:hypothetical protein
LLSPSKAQGYRIPSPTGKKEGKQSDTERVIVLLQNIGKAGIYKEGMGDVGKELIIKRERRGEW